MHHANQTIVDVATASVTPPCYGDLVALLLIAGVATFVALAIHTWRENKPRFPGFCFSGNRPAH